MKLLTADIRRRLLRNGLKPDADHRPALKIFNPMGAATWLFTSLDADEDRLFGLCDLGHGYPELGHASLAEMAAIRLPLGLGLERDLHFRASHPLSVYARAARTAGYIVESRRELDAAAAAVQAPARPRSDAQPRCFTTLPGAPRL